MKVSSLSPTAFPANGGLAGRILRLLAPFALIPLGMAYCLIYEFFFEFSRLSVGGSFIWAVATLSPWVAAVLIFESRVRAGEARSRLLRRALLLAFAAYAASGIAALLLGSGGERAFYSRLPLVAAAVLAALLYPIRARSDPDRQAAANDDDPPVAPTEIVFASAAGNYVELHSGGRTFIWRQTMHNAERILRPAGFVRVHRSYIVPWRSIETVTRGRKGPVELALRNGSRVPVSNRYAANLRNQGRTWTVA